MKKWEKDYEEFKNGKVDDKLVELQEKVDKKIATKDDLKEIKRINTAKSNISKIDNILEYRNSLTKKVQEIENQIKEIETQKKEIENSEKIQNDIIELESKMTSIKIEEEAIKEKLKDKNLEDDKRNSLQEKLNDLKKEKNDNNIKFIEKQQLLDESKEKVGKTEGKDIEKLKETKMDISQKISKCDMIANNLVKGKTWDYIEFKLDNWENKKFKSNEKIEKYAKKVEGKGKEQSIQETRSVRDIKENEKLDLIEETQLEEISEFDLNHPRIAKIKNWIKIKAKAISDKIRKPKEEPVEEPVEKLETLKNLDNEFKEYIKKIAENGMSSVEKNEKDEKMKKFKEEAYKREQKKFGKDYAEKSYHKEETKQEEK